MRIKNYRADKAKCKMKENEPSERLLDFAAIIIKLVVRLNKNAVMP